MQVCLGSRFVHVSLVPVSPIIDYAYFEYAIGRHNTKLQFASANVIVLRKVVVCAQKWQPLLFSSAFAYDALGTSGDPNGQHTRH